MTAPDPEEHHGPRLEAALMVSGVLVFIASFLPWYAATFEGGVAESGVTGTYNAWHGIAGVGLLLVLSTLFVNALQPMLGEDAPVWPFALGAAVLACVGAALIVVRSFHLPTVDIPGVTTELRWGGWILIVLVIVHAGISVLRAVHSRDTTRSGGEVH